MCNLNLFGYFDRVLVLIWFITFFAISICAMIVFYFRWCLFRLRRFWVAIVRAFAAQIFAERMDCTDASCFERQNGLCASACGGRGQQRRQKRCTCYVIRCLMCAHHIIMRKLRFCLDFAIHSCDFVLHDVHARGDFQQIWCFMFHLPRFVWSCHMFEGTVSCFLKRFFSFNLLIYYFIISAQFLRLSFAPSCVWWPCFWVRRRIWLRTEIRRWYMPPTKVTWTVCGCWSMPGPTKRPRTMFVVGRCFDGAPFCFMSHYPCILAALLGLFINIMSHVDFPNLPHRNVFHHQVHK